MKHIFSLLFASLVLLATISVSHAALPAQVQLPTIKKDKAAAYAAAITSPALYVIANPYAGDGHGFQPFDVALHGMYQVPYLASEALATSYSVGYSYRHKSLSNYWPGYTRLV